MPYVQTWLGGWCIRLFIRCTRTISFNLQTLRAQGTSYLPAKADPLAESVANSYPKGEAMAEALRSDAPPENPEYPQAISGESHPQAKNSYPGAPDHDTPLPGMPTGSNLLPAYASGGNRRLNRSAEAIGRTAGVAVSTVRQVPQSIEEAKTRLRRAGESLRQSASAAAMEQVDSFVGRANMMRDSAAQKVSTLGDLAASRAGDIKDVATARLEDFRRVATNEISQTREKVRASILAARSRVEYWQREYPVQTIAVMGGAAFVVGIILRAWRSRDE